MLESYRPGKHLLLTLQVNDPKLLCDLEGFLQFTQEKLDQYDLKMVGCSSHSFDGAGFTAAVCLMESHICVHTWPEFSQLTLDVYLCNYLKDNSEKVLDLGKEYKAYFESTVLTETLVNR
ncbi:S-adenosylmethionine decarboxylase [Sphingobacterium sp. WM]|uniref:S-adenosylmethionine decarboxylase family protein n=1 Tax=Sphingobacterium sp. WM TaxID=3031802 RepID=UPI00240D651D|nr:S-adenosylmethionine decarboxylase [Sphingobacterium sp. WM]WFB62156.1 S-adenosylmethionine decarboxylase [Sphingobacterium sp. WM]